MTAPTIQIVPNSDGANAPFNSDSVAYEASRVVKAGPGVVYGISGYNSGPAQFIQLYDAVAAPAAASVPAFMISVPTLSNFSIDFGVYGRKFTIGIVIGNSTTGPTRTAGAADTWFNTRYR